MAGCFPAADRYTEKRSEDSDVVACHEDMIGSPDGFLWGRFLPENRFCAARIFATDQQSVWILFLHLSSGKGWGMPGKSRRTERA
jgi:hypothetical protein